MSTTSGVVLQQLALCDTDLGERRRQRGDIIERLERQRATITSLKTTGARQKKQVRAGQETPFATASLVRDEFETRYRNLVQEFEGSLKRSAPVLVELAEKMRQIEQERIGLLAELPPKARVAYQAHILAGRLPAIVPADSGNCAACRAVLPVDRAGLDGLETCPSCHRLVYTTLL